MRYALMLFPFIVGACTPPPSQISDNDGVALADVVRRVKLELALYQDYERTAANETPVDNACRGYVNFHVTKVQMTLQTVRIVDAAASASVGLPVPVPFKLGISGGGHRISKNTQTLDLSIFPLSDSTPRDKQTEDDLHKIRQDAPLAQALIATRMAVLARSDMRPCYLLSPNNSGVGNKVSFVMNVETKTNVGIDFSYTLLSLGAARATDNDYSNTIAVTFEPYLDPSPKAGEPQLPPQIPTNPHGTGHGLVF